MSIAATSVRVPARWIDGDQVRCDVALFRLGPGPCGLTVTGLMVDTSSCALTISQEHSDGTRKAFIYPLSQLTGRVEIEA